MKRDFKTWMILVAFAIPLVPLLFLLTIYFSNCGINANCASGNLAGVIHTPIPTLLPATLSAATRARPHGPANSIHFHNPHTRWSGRSSRAVQPGPSGISHQSDRRFKIRDGIIR